MNKPRVLMADDHTLVLDGLRKLLEESCEIVGVAEEGRTLLEQAKQLEPDIITLDISLPLLNGIEAARQLRKVVPRAKLIFVTMHADPAYVNEAFKAGASGYVIKRSAGEELIRAIKAVASGNYYATPLITKGLIHSALEGKTPSFPEHHDLTSRQREVLQLVAEGRSNKEIATLLDISIKTVEFHKTQIMEQLHLHTTADLTKYAMTHGIISSE